MSITERDLGYYDGHSDGFRQGIKSLHKILLEHCQQYEQTDGELDDGKEDTLEGMWAMLFAAKTYGQVFGVEFDNDSV